MMDSRFSRRYFFYGSLLAGAVPAGGFGSVPSLPSTGYKSPNEKLNIASIGAGGQAAGDIQRCASENIIALCDVDSVQAARMFNQYPNVPKYTDFRKMLDKEGRNIDAVIIGTPDHMHGACAMWCMERGKHVYVEKPLTRTPWEARQLAEGAAKYKVATQMGNQGYSNNGARVASEIVWSGEIGDVTEVHAFTTRPIWPQGMTEIPPPAPVPSTLDWDCWLGIAKERPYAGPPTNEAQGLTVGGRGGAGGGFPAMAGPGGPGGTAAGRGGLPGGAAAPRGAYLPFNWRGFYDFGCGPLGDMACHILGSVNMALMLGYPKSVEAIKVDGKSPFAFPKHSILAFEFPARHNMPPVKIYWYDALNVYPKPYWPEGIPETEPIFGGAGAFGPDPSAAAARAAAAARGGAGAPGGAAGGRGAAGTPGGVPAGPAGAAGAAAAGRGGAGAGRGLGISEGAIFVGKKGFMTTDTYGASVRLLPLARHQAYQLPAQVLSRAPEHHMDWIRACKGGTPACSNFSVAGPFTEWLTLGAIALRFDGKLEWDAEKMRFTNNAQANELVKPSFRKGWSFV